jgi:hypothetical protein
MMWKGGWEDRRMGGREDGRKGGDYFCKIE